jgi:hypothetical protein
VIFGCLETKSASLYGCARSGNKQQQGASPACMAVHGLINEANQSLNEGKSIFY